MTLAPDAQRAPQPRGSPTSQVRPRGTPPHLSVSRYRPPPGPVAGGPGYTRGRVVLYEVRLCVNLSSAICELSDLGQMILQCFSFLPGLWWGLNGITCIKHLPGAWHTLGSKQTMMAFITSVIIINTDWYSTSPAMTEQFLSTHISMWNTLSSRLHKLGHNRPILWHPPHMF